MVSMRGKIAKILTAANGMLSAFFLMVASACFSFPVFDGGNVFVLVLASFILALPAIALDVAGAIIATGKGRSLNLAFLVADVIFEKVFYFCVEVALR